MKTPGWTRKPSPYGKGTCGAKHIHVSGHKVIHCGHPTALWPYYIVTPTGETVFAPNGRGFKHLAAAKAEAERRANATTKENNP